MTFERDTVHISDDTGRIAMRETFDSDIYHDSTTPELTRYIYSDQLQSASVEMDDSGDLLTYEEYHPYGTTSYQMKDPDMQAAAKRYRYTGKERDEESGLYYHGARYYVPWLGRWTACDPLESKYAGMSPYNYSFNNPIKWNDLSGMQPGDPPQGGVSTVDETKVAAPIQTFNLYNSPDGGILQLPITANVESTFNGAPATSGGVPISPVEGSVWTFSYKKEVYGAQFDDKGTFTGYQSYSNENHKLQVGLNTTPKVDPNSGKKAQLSEASMILFAPTTKVNPYVAAGAIALGTYLAVDALTKSKTMDLPIGLSSPRVIPFNWEEVREKPVLLPYSDAVTKAPNDPNKDYFVKYTNAEGLAKFALEGVLRPNDQGKVYLTKSFLTPDEVERDIFIGDAYGKGRGNYMLIFLVDPDQSANIQKEISQPLEWTYSPGSLRIRPGNLLYMGPNPKK